METALQWYGDRLNRVYYSMAYRNGQLINDRGQLSPSGRPGFDCSSSLYYALIAAGMLPADTRIGNTDSLYGDLERNGWVQVRPDATGYIDARRGDVFLWGKRGASGGAFGHTGMFTSADDIIHCSYGYNGINVNNHDWLWGINRNPEVTVYRYTGATAPAPYTGDTDQELSVGSTIRFDGVYTADDVQFIGGIWQVRANALCRDGFTWDENGIPAEPVYEVDADGFQTADQELDIGSRFKIPGKYTVLDLGEYEGRWLAMIEWSGYKFWVDVEPLTEIMAADDGAPIPADRPAAPQPPIASSPEPATPPEIEPPVVQPDVPTKPDEAPPIPTQPTAPNEPTEPVIPSKEDDMAYSKEDQEKLAIQSQRVQETLKEIAESEEVRDLIGGVNKRVKLAVYIVGDTLIGLGLLVPSLAVVFNWGDITQIVALSSVFATTGAFLLTMFGIYKSGK